jgi:hypothetical protein
LESLLHGRGEASSELERLHAKAETQDEFHAKGAERVMEEWSVKDGTRTELIGMM